MNQTNPPSVFRLFVTLLISVVVLILIIVAIIRIDDLLTTSESEQISQDLKQAAVLTTQAQMTEFEQLIKYPDNKYFIEMERLVPVTGDFIIKDLKGKVSSVDNTVFIEYSKYDDFDNERIFIRLTYKDAQLANVACFKFDGTCPDIKTLNIEAEKSLKKSNQQSNAINSLYQNFRLG